MLPRGMILGACILAVPLLGLLANERFRNDVREIDFKGVKPQAGGQPDKPTVIGNGEELAKAIPDEQTRARIRKEIDFDKERLLYFAWTGSGEDRLTWDVNVLCSKSREREVIFRYHRGRTDDTKSHIRLLAIPKDKRVSWRFKDTTK